MKRAKEQAAPRLAVDALLERQGKVLLVRRKNPPYGWALPGGFVDHGEPAGEALRRETREETGLTVTAMRLLGAYSDPARDPRGHTVGLVFVVEAAGEPAAADDAADLAFFSRAGLPADIAFDHRRILEDYYREGIR